MVKNLGEWVTEPEVKIAYLNIDNMLIPQINFASLIEILLDFYQIP